MPSIQIGTNYADSGKWLDKKYVKQLPFAQSLALNRTAKIVKTGIVDVMQKRYHKPTRYTLNSLRIKYANKRQRIMQASVAFIDDSFKGTPAANYLSPTMFGEGRRHKRFEKALINKGMMKTAEYAVPAAGAVLDAHGNVKRGQIVQILSALRAFGEQGYIANRTNSKRSVKKQRKSPYFVGNPGNQGAGIWKANDKEGTVVPVFLFVDAPKYRIRIPFDKITANMVNKHLPEQLDKALDEAWKTRR